MPHQLHTLGLRECEFDSHPRYYKEKDMRVSVIEGDPGFLIDAYDYKVFLDGVELPMCVTADEELGEAVIIKEKDGKILLNEDNGAIHETVKGKIKIQRVEQPARGM